MDRKQPRVEFIHPADDESALGHARKLEGTSEDSWYVTNGVVATGPIGFNLLSRGIAHGRVALTAFVRHASWRVWRRLKELEHLDVSERNALVKRLAEASAGVEPRSPHHESGETLRVRSDYDSQPPSTLRPPPIDPVGVLASATCLSDALMLCVTTAMTAASADIALLLRATPSGHLRVESTSGGGSELLLGETLSPSDAAAAAVRSGRSLIAEARDGAVARSVSARLERAAGQVTSVASLPIFLLGEPFAALELGRVFGGFRARDVARAEDVTEALIARIVVDGWVD
ncbi:MAG: hypothetical protein H6718_34720 [Polyangiaceae bacterium]|nr:hypothetical protein [Polyangiaceae bacterium]MCB9608121.1 hypothetical protein [Polyangiaceae bacterium]